MPRDLKPHNRATVKLIESLGYRVCVGEIDGVWIATAKIDHPEEFHRIRLTTEDEAVAALAESVGIDLAD